MNTLKKLFALALALVLVLSLAVPGMAYTITIEGSQSNEVEGSADGHIYEAYQILSGTVDDVEEGSTETPSMTGFTWGADIDPVKLLDYLKADNTFTSVTGKDENDQEIRVNWFANINPNAVGTGTDGATIYDADSAVAFADIIADKKTKFTSQALVDKLAQYIYGSVDGTASFTTDETDKTAPYTLEVSPGYYMIKDKDGSLDGQENKDYTDVILQVSKDTTIYHKGSVPTVKKEVAELGVGYGGTLDTTMQDTYYYRLTGTLPDDYDKYHTYEYIFTDEMADGITFGNIVEVYVLRTSGSRTDLNEITAGNTSGAYTVIRPGDILADGTTNGNKLVIRFANLKHDDDHHKFQKGDKIMVVYSAKLNENAVVGGDGNQNSVTLQYTNNPNYTGLGETSTEKTTTYTYGLQLIKHKNEDKTDVMKDVTFVLYRKVSVNDTTNPGATIEQTQYAVVNTDSTDTITDGTITAWSPNPYDATVGADGVRATLLETDDKGAINVYGLDQNVTYYLKEIDTHDGVNLIQDEMPFLLVPVKDSTGKVTGVTVSANHTHFNNATAADQGGAYQTDAAGTVQGGKIFIPNYSGPVLPTTGGMGTTLFYIIGSVLVIGAVVLLITKKRMR